MNRRVTNHTFQENFMSCIWKKNDHFTKWHLILLTNLPHSWCCFLHPTCSQQTSRVYLDFKLLAFSCFYGLCRLSTNLLYTNSALIGHGKACNHGNILCTLSQAIDVLFTLYGEQIIYILLFTFFLLIPSQIANIWLTYFFTKAVFLVIQVLLIWLYLDYKDRVAFLS